MDAFEATGVLSDLQRAASLVGGVLGLAVLITAAAAIAWVIISGMGGGGRDD